MADPQGLAFFGVLHQLMSFNFTLSPGITPNVASLVIPPQPGELIKQGDLRLQYGRNTITFRNARVDDVRTVFRSDGKEVWELTIMDRRWVWRETGEISGFYNTRYGNDSIRNPKSARDLATLCLEAMNETKFEVSVLPLKAFPEVAWEYTNPAEALAAICDKFQAYVTLGLDDRVRIAKIGEGAGLSNQNILEGSITIDPPDPPGKIVFVGARDRFQGDFRLEPVGLDLDYKIRPIDELSYIPKVQGRKTWERSDVEHFSGIGDLRARAYAQASVFRWYRIKTPYRLPGVADEIKFRYQVLPMEGVQIETATNFDGDEEPIGAYIYGRYWRGDEAHDDNVDVFEPNIEGKPESLYTKAWQLDTELGIAKFADPIYRLKETFDLQGQPLGHIVLTAELALRTAVGLRGQNTRSWFRTEVERKPPSRSRVRKSIRFIRIEDVARERWRKYTPQAGIQDNIDEFKAEAERHITATEAEYTPKQAGTFSFPGLLPVQIDGAIQQVTWSINEEGVATTRASRNQEELLPTASFKERRFGELVFNALKERDKTQRQTQIDARQKRG